MIGPPINLRHHTEFSDKTQAAVRAPWFLNYPVFKRFAAAGGLVYLRNDINNMEGRPKTGDVVIAIPKPVSVDTLDDYTDWVIAACAIFNPHHEGYEYHEENGNERIRMDDLSLKGFMLLVIAF